MKPTSHGISAEAYEFDSDISTREWPQRWHEVVAEYNTAFEFQQNKMRAHFENQFDIIRRDNDKILSQLRNSRDACTGRVCDILDAQSEVCIIYNHLNIIS